MMWSILDTITNVLIAALWTSVLLLIFTLTSSPYNSKQSVNVLKLPGRSPRRQSSRMNFNDGTENKDDDDIDETDNKNNKNDNGKLKVDKRTKEKYKARKAYRKYFRMFLTWFFILPILVLSSLLVNILQVIARLSHPICNLSMRMWLSNWFAGFWYPVLLFTLEYWPNITYYVYDVNPDLYNNLLKHNALCIANHAQSPFDWITTVSFADAIGRVSRGYGVMKRLFLMIPTVGFTGALAGSIALNRNWNADKKRLTTFFHSIKKHYVEPWVFVIYPEGTRQTPKKLDAAQTFAKSRGFVVLDNLLQPRVKGFTFFVHQLGHKEQAMEYIIDLTNVYKPKAPSFKRFALTGRLHDKLEMIVRIYKISDLPKETKEIDQWIRDRWTEKDKIIDDMKQGKIEYRLLHRNPLKAVVSYAVWCIFFAYLTHFLFRVSPLYCILWLVTSLFPILMVYIERSNQNLHNFLLSTEANLSTMMKQGINGFTDNIQTNLRYVKEKTEDIKDLPYNFVYNSNKPQVNNLSKSDFVSVKSKIGMKNGNNNDIMDGMDVNSDNELYGPQTASNRHKFVGIDDENDSEKNETTGFDD